MEEKDIFKLIKTFEESSLSVLDISKDSFSIHLERKTEAGFQKSNFQTEMSNDEPKQAATSVLTSQAIKTEEDKNKYTEVKSPIVGVFYQSPSPDEKPFVEAGQKVNKGQILCLVEAMKMMNEIKAPVDGIIKTISGKNGELVEFGQILFEVEEC